MSKHTPGPWHAVAREVLEDGSVYPAHIASDARESQVCLLESPYIADLAQNEPGSLWDTSPRKEADARLLTAAPDLLEALSAMTALAEGPTGGVSVADKREVIAQARAAIAKAVGP